MVGDDLSRIFGVPILTRDDYLARVHPDDLPYVERRFQRAIATGEKYTGTVRIIHPAGGRVVRFSGWLTVVDGVVERIRGEVRVIGPCEQDRILPRPWHYSEAEE